jgi:leader peptidase (prepilin peptidase)/N-methyltransferase
VILEIFINFLVFGLGVAMGSFGNVVIDRSGDDRSIIKGRSECDDCKKKLSWKENIPVISYLWLKGKCGSCGAKIGWRTLGMEIAMAVGFLLIFNFPVESFAHRKFLKLGGQAFLAGRQIIPNMLFYWGVVVTIIADLEYGIIPDWAVGAIGLAGLIKWGLSPTLLIGAGLSFLFFWLLIKLTKEKGMGWGDAKLAPALFYFGGFWAGLWGLVYAFWIGAGVGVILILLGKKKMKGSTLPFGPFMILGLILALLTV